MFDVELTEEKVALYTKAFDDLSIFSLERASVEVMKGRTRRGLPLPGEVREIVEHLPPIKVKALPEPPRTREDEIENERNRLFCLYAIAVPLPVPDPDNPSADPDWWRTNRAIFEQKVLDGLIEIKEVRGRVRFFEEGVLLTNGGMISGVIQKADRL